MKLQTATKSLGQLEDPQFEKKCKDIIADIRSILGSSIESKLLIINFQFWSKRVINLNFFTELKVYNAWVRLIQSKFGDRNKLRALKVIYIMSIYKRLEIEAIPEFGRPISDPDAVKLIYLDQIADCDLAQEEKKAVEKKKYKEQEKQHQEIAQAALESAAKVADSSMFESKAHNNQQIETYTKVDLNGSRVVQVAKLIKYIKQ